MHKQKIGDVLSTTAQGHSSWLPVTGAYKLKLHESSRPSSCLGLSILSTWWFYASAQISSLKNFEAEGASFIPGHGS